MQQAKYSVQMQGEKQTVTHTETEGQKERNVSLSE